MSTLPRAGEACSRRRGGRHQAHWECALEFCQPRLHLLIAKNSDNGIVIRRGPSKQVFIMAWDRSRNTFTVSQWLKGRLYERRSDISPSGKYWIYFAMNGKWQSEVKGSWTAIARVPWLKAIELLPKGECILQLAIANNQIKHLNFSMSTRCIYTFYKELLSINRFLG